MLPLHTPRRGSALAAALLTTQVALNAAVRSLAQAVRAAERK